MKEKNKPVGSSPCPIKGCDRTVQVFKYRQRSDDPTKRRFAGRLYAECEKDGRIENQEFLLENIKWHENEKRPEPSAPVAAPEPTRAAQPPPQPTRAAAQESRPAPAEPAKSSKKASWIPEFFK